MRQWEGYFRVTYTRLLSRYVQHLRASIPIPQVPARIFRLIALNCKEEGQRYFSPSRLLSLSIIVPCVIVSRVLLFLSSREKETRMILRKQKDLKGVLTKLIIRVVSTCRERFSGK